MKAITILLAVFLLAFVTSGLLEFEFILKNSVRYFLVCFMIFIEIALGLIYMFYQLKNNKNVK